MKLCKHKYTEEIGMTLVTGMRACGVSLPIESRKEIAHCLKCDCLVVVKSKFIGVKTQQQIEDDERAEAHDRKE